MPLSRQYVHQIAFTSMSKYTARLCLKLGGTDAAVVVPNWSRLMTVGMENDCPAASPT